MMENQNHIPHPEVFTNKIETNKLLCRTKLIMLFTETTLEVCEEPDAEEALKLQTAFKVNELNQLSQYMTVTTLVRQNFLNRTTLALKPPNSGMSITLLLTLFINILLMSLATKSQPLSLVQKNIIFPTWSFLVNKNIHSPQETTVNSAQ